MLSGHLSRDKAASDIHVVISTYIYIYIYISLAAAKADAGPPKNLGAVKRVAIPTILRMARFRAARSS